MSASQSGKRLRVVYAGTPDFAVPALRLLHESAHTVAAVYTQPDRRAGRGRKLAPSAVKQFAQSHGLAVEQPADLNGDAINRLRDYAPDVIVVAAYGVLLPPPVLDLPPYGCLNIHASLLPRWRGAAPLQRAILAGDTVSGASIMLMDAGLDTGPVLHSVSVPIDDTTTGSALHDAVAVAGADALFETLPAWCNGQINPVAQRQADACYAAKLSKSEAVIDWSEAAAAVHRKIMAFNAWPVAQTGFDNRVLRIWRSRPVGNVPPPLAEQKRSPGLMQRVGSQLFVACADTWLELLEVQAPGKRTQPVEAFLNANTLSGHMLADPVTQPGSAGQQTG